jgi:hypothetical protein
MGRLYGVATWLCISLGLALLMFSVALVPSQSFADDGGASSLLSVCKEDCKEFSGIHSCLASYPGICSLGGVPCENSQRPADCANCSCLWHVPIMDCKCKLFGT